MTLLLNSHSFASSLILALLSTVPGSVSECLSDPTLDTIFAQDVNGVTSIPKQGSCCQQDVCAIPCPVPVDKPAVGYGIAVGATIIISCLIGFVMVFWVRGKAVNFFVAGRTLPLYVVVFALAASSIDSNALLGNANLSYKYSFWDGAVLPIGLGVSLILNGIFFAAKIQREHVLTLPDVFAKRYGKIIEVFVSIATICSFLMLLAGNLVGMGSIVSYVWSIEIDAAIYISAAILWVYTVSGGLFSVAYTDLFQGALGWTGNIVLAFYLIFKWRNTASAPPPSIGFPGYVYPNSDICSMYEGIPCDNDLSLCCYNAARWCPDIDNCFTDNGAYPFGDKRVFNNQMLDPKALSPFPNAIIWNWATIFILGFGNLAALDFQARCMASKTPTVAWMGCIIAGFVTFLIGIPYAYMGSITRVFYGPDSPRAEFVADSCSKLLGLPTCALWKPDENAFLKLLTHEAPPVLGAWCALAIVAASMSTADGAILAMGTVFAHNLVRQLDVISPKFVTSDNLLLMARISTIPVTICSTMIAIYYHVDRPLGATGYLLIVAFDIVLATVVVPLFGAFYCKTPRANAALAAMLTGASLRIIFEYTLPKDGYAIFPFKYEEFQDVGPAASDKYPIFFDQPTDQLWNPSVESCATRQFRDYTGVDSLVSFVAAALTFLLVQVIEWNGPLFTIPGQKGYTKNIGEEANADELETVEKNHDDTSGDDALTQEEISVSRKNQWNESD